MNQAKHSACNMTLDMHDIKMALPEKAHEEPFFFIWNRRLRFLPCQRIAVLALRESGDTLWPIAHCAFSQTANLEGL